MEAQKRRWRRDMSYMKGHNGLEWNDVKQLVHGVDTSFCYLHNPKVQIMVLFQNKSEKGSIWDKVLNQRQFWPFDWQIELIKQISMSK
jgi:hypothetical protein